MEKGKIIAINIFKEKGNPPISVENAHCSLDYGLQGDRFGGKGDKQLTLMDKSTKDWMDFSTIKGLCFSKFIANIITENLDVSALNTGDRLFCADAMLEISACKKECFEQCILRQKGAVCRLSTGGVYLKVKSFGNIKIGDRIESKL